MNAISQGKLLSAEELTACQQIGSRGTVEAQRANALLAMNEGASQQEASKRSGLTTNQVRYWLGRFRTRRLAIFARDVAEPEAEARPHPPADAKKPDRRPRKVKEEKRKDSGRKKKAKDKEDKKDKRKKEKKNKKRKLKGKKPAAGKQVKARKSKKSKGAAKKKTGKNRKKK